MPGGLSSARPARALPQRQAAPTASHALVRQRPSDAGKSPVDGTCATSRSPTACSSAGDRRTSSSTCGKSSCLMHSSITGSSRRTRPAPSPIPSAVLWIRKEVRAARADLAKLEREYGAAAADNAEQHRPTMRGFKIAHGTLGKRLRTARARVARLFEQRRDVAKRVEIRDLSEKAVVKLATERKHLTDIIKMVAYQAESDLIALLQPHYARADQEGRTLLHELFAAAADLSVTDHELQITLAPLSSPHRTRAAQALCEMLDQTATIFPGSRPRLRFAVNPRPRIGLAFPGSPAERAIANTVAAPP